MRLDHIITPNDNKLQHYSSEIYKSLMFTSKAITQWAEAPAHQQTYANTRPFLEAKQRRMETIQRLTTGATVGAGFGLVSCQTQEK